MRKYLLLILFLTQYLFSGYAQHNYKANKKQYQAGLRLFSKEEYSKALPLFLQLDSVPNSELIKDPHENKYVVDNEAVSEIKILIKYHIGACYSINKFDKRKAIPYFEYVLKSNYNREPESIFIDLGNIYHQNYQFTKALHCFEKYTKLYGEKDQQGLTKPDANIEYAKKMVSICKEAQMLYNDSLKINISDIGAPINTDNSEFNPLISADESQLIFNRIISGAHLTNGQQPMKIGGVEDSVIQTLISHKTNGKWQTPVSIIFNPSINFHSVLLAGLTKDGQELFLQIKDGETTNIYSCMLSENRCENLHKLNTPVNSGYNQGKVSISADGTEMYFSSDRSGGYGKKDIYKITKNEKGEWTGTSNPGSQINTKYDEEAPYIHSDKKTLYFCSNGQKSMGGYDIFKTILKDDGEWSTPVNLSYPINTINNECDFSISASGQTGYYSKIYDKISGKRHIYTFTINQNIPLTLVKGTIMAGDPLKPVAAKIKVIDKETNTRVKYIYDPNPKTGQYLLIFPPGKDYDIIVESKEYLPQLINVHIPNQTYFYELFQEIHLKPLNLLDKKLGEEISVSNTFIDVFKPPNNKDVISKTGEKDYGKLINLVEKLIYTTDSIGLEKIDKTFDKIFKEEQIKKDSTYKKDMGRLIDFIDKAIQTTDSSTLVMLDKNTIYRKDYKQKYFYSEGKPKDLHRVMLGKDTLYSAPPLNTKEEDIKSKADSAISKIFHKEKRIDVKNIKPEEKKVILTYKVFFVTGKSDIDNQYYKEMREIVKLLRENSNLYLEIYGYCDSRGGIEENNELSEKRANKVLNYFNEIGINTDTATVIGFGKTYSKDEKTDEDRQKNRRVDVRIFEYIKK